MNVSPPFPPSYLHVFSFTVLPTYSYYPLSSENLFKIPHAHSDVKGGYGNRGSGGLLKAQKSFFLSNEKTEAKDQREVI